MVQNEEMLIFINELRLLLEEYKRCNDSIIQEEIYDTILLLSEVINL